MTGLDMPNDELPEGWASVPLKELVELNPKANHADDLQVGFVPMPFMGTRFGELVRFETRPWGDVKKGYTHFQDGDVLLAKITPCFENGKGGLIRGLPNGVGAGSTEYFVCRPHAGRLLPEYLLGFLKTPEFMSEGATQMTGSVGHKRVPKDFLLDSQLPLAPLAEQKRIAEKLEAVLGRVDACRARLDRVPALLKRFRQSVLAAATSGQLTEDWREKNSKTEAVSDVQREIAELMEARRIAPTAKVKFKEPVSPDMTHWKTEIPSSWALVSVSAFAECLDSIRVPVKRDKRSSTQGLYPYYGANGEVDRVDEYLFDDELVLVTEDETFYGREKPIAYRSSGKCWVNNHAHVLKAADKESCDYLCFALMYYEIIPWLTGTTGRAKLTQGVLNALPMAVPPKTELIEIVRRVEALFAFADRIEARLSSAQKTVERLTPAVLAKAFRGHLVPQDPNDEPASALLERILKTRSPKLH